jgi:ABC-type dipeptide/oligopeptide/nickel transport system ATPase component
MTEVGIPNAPAASSNTRLEFFGGMRQRIVIAWPDAKSRYLNSDEPTTALDVTIQAQILELVNR